MIRPLFGGSYLQVRLWALENEKEEKFASNDKTCYCDREKGILERYISKVTV